MENNQELVKLICCKLNEKKGRDIRLVKVEKITTVTDYFIIVTADSASHMEALVNVIEEITSKNHIQSSRQGKKNWILIDCNDFVIHIFDEKTRLFYMLERIWADGEDISWEEC